MTHGLECVTGWEHNLLSKQRDVHIQCDTNDWRFGEEWSI